MVASRDSILELLKNNGPMVPNGVKKSLGGDTIIIGAMLAELSSRKLVKISHLKKGGSPFYYLEGQEAQLENCISFLSDKDQVIVNFLKEQKVLQDTQLEVYQRAALRQLKDFAKEFKVNTANGEVLFWRYYLLTEQEAISILNERFAPKPVLSEETTGQQTLESIEKKSVEEPVIETVEQVQEEINSEVESVQEKELEETPVVTAVEENGIEVDVPDSVLVNKQEGEVEKQVEVPEAKTETKTQTETQIETKTPSESVEKSVVKSDSEDDTCEEVVEKVYEEITQTDLEETEFYLKIKSYFDSKEIKVYEETQLSKDKEYEFTIGLHSSIGELKMLCRCRNKKRLNESDVAPALLRAKSREQFLLFLTPGEFTKKSKLLMDKEYKGLTIEQLE